MAAAQAAQRALGAPDVVARKGSGTPLVMVTAYDAPSARAVDTAGVDMILVGDSVAMVVLGYDDTLHVTIHDMAHHTGAVARTQPRAMVVADLPWMSYHLARDETVANAAQLVRAGATAALMTGSGSALFGLFADCNGISRAKELLGEVQTFPIWLVGRARYRALWRRSLKEHTTPGIWPLQSRYSG